AAVPTAASEDAGMPAAGQNESHPRIATSALGDFVVTWQRTNGDGDADAVMARRFDSQALAPEADFIVNTVTTDVQSVPDVAMGVDGSFLVTWQSGDGVSDDIHAQPFGICTEPVGPEFIVNTYTTGEQKAPQVSTDEHGQFVIAWTGPSPVAGAADDVHAQIL